MSRPTPTHRRPADPIRDPVRIAQVRATGLLDTPPDEAFDALARTAATVLDAPFAFVTLVDDRRSFWKSCIGIDFANPADRQNTVEESFCQYVIVSDEPLIVGDAAHHPVTSGNPSIAAMGVAAWAGFPVHGPDGGVLGSFCVVDTVVREWSERDVEVLRTLSGAAAREFALRDTLARTQAALAQRDTAREQLALLSDVAQSLSESLDPAAVATGLARLVVPVLGDWSIVSLLDEDGLLRDVGWWHVDEEQRANARIVSVERETGLAGRDATSESLERATSVVVTDGVLEQGLRIFTTDTARQALRELAPASYGTFPLLARQRVIGVLLVSRRADRAPLNEDEMSVAAGVANRAALALDNARLYERQRTMTVRLHETNARMQVASQHDSGVARALQDAMLTRLPKPDHLSLTARYLTADESDQVGGDWYDALLTTDGACTLVIGDVAGHDIGAAAVMGQLRNLLRAFAWNDSGETPAGLIARLDRAMHDLGIDRMTTLCVARVEQLAEHKRDGVRTVRWSSAGHPLPVLLGADGTVAQLDGLVDPPLCAGPGVMRRDHVCVVQPESTLLLYTDGLTETRDLDIDARLATLLASVGAARDGGLDGLVDEVIADLVGGSPNDDVVVLAVRFHDQSRLRPVE